MAEIAREHFKKNAQGLIGGVIFHIFPRLSNKKKII